MAALALRIVEPLHNDVFKGAKTVRLRGAPVKLPSELATIPLYYRWYSGLHPATDGAYSLNGDPLSDPATVLSASTDPGTAQTFPADAGVLAPLGPGTHAVTFAVTDQRREGSSKEPPKVRHGGVTGGAPTTNRSGAEVGTPCVIHVLFAAFDPDWAPRTLSQASCTIDVLGPSAWITEACQLINRIGYRFMFQPTNAGPAANLAPGNGTFVRGPNRPQKIYRGPWEVLEKPEVPPPKKKREVLRYTGSLPSTLVVGQPYALRLRVERLAKPREADDLGEPSDEYHESGPVNVVIER